MTLSKAGRSKLARARKQLTLDELFFYENAGYSHDPKKETAEQGRLRCAKELARAEQYAQDNKWKYVWLWDESPDLSWMSDEEREQENEVLGCILMTPDDAHAQSLWGIVNADSKYRRVVEAKLADEQLACVEKERRESQAVYNYNAL